MAKRQVFYSFHYKPDCWRASTVRSIGAIEGNKPATDNEWEKITSAGDEAIKKWINDQMKYRSCTIVLVGSKTANRKWINYEIVKSWNDGMGVVGIYIHGLKNSQGYIAERGVRLQNYFSLKREKLKRKGYGNLLRGSKKNMRPWTKIKLIRTT